MRRDWHACPPAREMASLEQEAGRESDQRGLCVAPQRAKICREIVSAVPRERGETR